MLEDLKLLSALFAKQRVGPLRQVATIAGIVRDSKQLQHLASIPLLAVSLRLQVAALLGLRLPIVP